MLRRVAATLVAGVCVFVATPRPAAAQGSCSRVVVVTLPAVTWEDIARVRPPNLLAAIADGATGSIAVRTVSSRTTPASAFATLGAGARMEGGRMTGGPGDPDAIAPRVATDVPVAGVDDLRALAADAGYNAMPGALAGATDVPVHAAGNGDLGFDPPSPVGRGRWAFLAAMEPDGTVAWAASGTDLLVPAPDAPFSVKTDAGAMSDALRDALAPDCSVLIADDGDLERVDAAETLQLTEMAEARDDALASWDRTLGEVRGLLDDDDLLIVVSSTSPGWDPEVHLGVAVAVGPRFPAGASLRSGSTRADGIVTLPDIAPTVLRHLGDAIPPEMLGRPFVAVPGAAEDPIATGVALDRESVFSHGIQPDVATSFVIFQVIVYLIATVLLWGGRSVPESVRRWLTVGALCVISFPLASYLATPLPGHRIGLAWLATALVLIDFALVAITSLLLREPLDRFLAVVGATLAVMVVDLALGAPLQFNGVFGYEPITAGRFAGLGNLGFAILSSSAILTAALMFHRSPRSRWVPWAAAALLIGAVIADGAPQLGSDVGGVLALVPAAAITWVLLSGRRPTWKVAAIGLMAAVVAVVLFLALDLARPPDEQTHLGRFFEDIRTRGMSVFLETLERKARANLRVFGSTIWTYLVPPAIALLASLLLRPRGRWGTVARAYPKLRAGLIGGLLVAVLGFAVNDSGIVVPAMVLSFLAPLALLMHLAGTERPDATGVAP